MAFQGQQQGPDMISLALNLMQMRRDNEFQERKFKLEEAKLAQQAQMDAIQAQRDQAEWLLGMQKSQLDLDNAMSERERALAPTLNAANDMRLSPTDRQTAANQFVRGIEEQIASGRSPTMVGGNAGAEAAAMRAGALDVRDVKTEDAIRSEAFNIRSENRAENRDIRREQRQREAEAEMAQLESDAIEAGEWTPKQITDLGVANEKRLAFTADLSKEWNRLSSLDPEEPTDVLELIQRWQKKVDEGAVVREGDITMLRSVGASGADNFLASAKGWISARKSFPPGFAENLKSSYEEMLSTDDQRAVEIDQEWQDYANRNGLTPAQRARAERWTRQVRQARERISGRESASVPGRRGSASNRNRRTLSSDQARALGLE